MIVLILLVFAIILACQGAWGLAIILALIALLVQSL
jgi:hypothetical protein